MSIDNIAAEVAHARLMQQRAEAEAHERERAYTAATQALNEALDSLLTGLPMSNEAILLANHYQQLWRDILINKFADRPHELLNNGLIFPPELRQHLRKLLPIFRFMAIALESKTLSPNRIEKLIFN